MIRVIERLKEVKSTLEKQQIRVFLNVIWVFTLIIVLIAM